MTQRAAGRAEEMEMGNKSTGTESVVSIALASPFCERNIPVPSIIPQQLKLVRLNGETRIHRLKRKDQKGHVEYWKAQCGESRMLRLDGGKGRKALPIRTKRFPLHQLPLNFDRLNGLRCP